MRRMLAVIGLVSGLVGGGQAARAADLLVGTDHIVRGTIAGRPVRLLVDPGAPTLPILSPDFARAIGAKPSPAEAVAIVGPTRLSGQTAVLRLQFPGDRKPRKARVAWFDSPLVAGVDAVVAPHFLTPSRVRIALGGRGGRETTMAYVDLGSRSRGVLTSFAGEKVEIVFNLHRPLTGATADAGRLVALAQGGRLTESGGTMPIAFGISRPYRDVTLATPLVAGPFRLPLLRVRITGAGSLGIPGESQDPDEIVVSGKDSRRPNRVIAIARDELDRCAWLETDRATSTIRFDCPAN